MNKLLYKNQKLLYIHVFTRDFFFGAFSLGWVYLYLAGMPIIKVLLGWVTFRIIESFITLPLARKALTKYSQGKLFMFSLILQGITIILFPWSVRSTIAFVLLVTIFSVWDVIYWPIRSNFERSVVGGVNSSQDIGQSVGLSGATSISANAAGLIVAAVGIQANSTLTFLIAAVGLLLSFIPLKNAHVKTGEATNISVSSFYKTMTLGRSLRSFFKLPITWLVMANGVISELTDLVLPLLLAFFAVQIINIGTVLSLLVILGFFANLLLAFSYDGRRRKIFQILNILVLSSFILFQFSAPIAASVFLLLFGVFGIPWQTGVGITAQEFVKNHFNPLDGGFFLMLWDVISRIPLILCVILLLFINAKDYFYSFTLAAGAIASLMILVAARKHYRLKKYGQFGL